MNQFFETQYSQEDLQRHVLQRRSQNVLRNNSMAMLPPPSPDEMDLSGMVGGDSLDDIIMQNSKELQRRQSLPHPFGVATLNQDDQQDTMMNFGPGNNGLNNFTFGAHTASNGLHDRNRRPSMDDMEMTGGFANMSEAMVMSDPSTGYAGALHANPLSIDTSVTFNGLSAEIMRDMMAYQSGGMSGMSGMSGDDIPAMFSANSFPHPFSANEMGPLTADYVMSMETAEDPMSSGSNEQHDLGNDEPDIDILPAVPGLTISENNGNGLGNGISVSQNLADYTSPTSPTVSRKRSNDDAFVPGVPQSAEAASPSSIPQPLPAKSTYQNIYSSSGFDMLRALMQVATRKHKEIEIGAVDMSCAFVVCDVTQPDCPIIYVSDIFERLTGYNKYEVLGRNCRFLQDPDGKVNPGSKRQNVDDDSVYYLKTRISELREAQKSLINYRKGGQPFMNLLTMIPITWDTDDIRYFVGFQVDLVEQPSAIASKNAGGSYTVNYSQGTLPPYVWSPPTAVQQQRESGQTISPDDVTALLIAFKNNNAESELSKRMWDKVLLENTDDVVHVLSLKGLFLYLSPSSQKVLEYDPSELVGTALSSVCHPSDIVPVTRELKDTSTGAAVNIVFRIRRKRSGYTWFESHGSLCVEQGKGRKCLILVGRERPVYALARHDIETAGGIGDNEVWTKLSTSGMLLFVSSSVKLLLDRQPDDLIGTSIQALMRPESKVEFGRSLEKARTGKQLIYKHEIMHKRGQVFQAQTTIYPGDAAEGQKPTFLVGQTRLLKPTSRGSAPGPTRGGLKLMSTMARDGLADDGHTSPNSRGDATPRSNTSNMTNNHVMTQAGGVGLAIGSQDAALASEDNIFDELKTTRCTSWQFELRQMERNNRLLHDELTELLQSKKKRKRRKLGGHLQQDCVNCHAKTTPEWRRGPSGKRDLCNSCGLRWAKQTGRISPRTSSRDTASKHSASPQHSLNLQKDVPNAGKLHSTASLNSSTATSTGTMARSTVIGSKTNGADKGTTADSQPTHAPSQGYNDGGPSRITKIVEADELSA